MSCGLSTRATITSTSFTNEYHWGDFRGSPHRLMEEYFDAFLYLANWGTRQIMLRLPAHLPGLETVQRYCVGDAVSASLKHDHLVVSLFSEDEDGADEWESAEGRLAPIATLRHDIASGDLRSLYLAWLLSVQAGIVDETAVEPPVPAGLGHPTAGLRALTDFLRIDEDLINAAAAANDDPTEDSEIDLAQWVQALPTDQKDGAIVRLLQGEAYVRAGLLRQFRERGARTGGAQRRRPSVFGAWCGRGVDIGLRRRVAGDGFSGGVAELGEDAGVDVGGGRRLGVAEGFLDFLEAGAGVAGISDRPPTHTKLAGRHQPIPGHTASRQVHIRHDVALSPPPLSPVTTSRCSG